MGEEFFFGSLNQNQPSHIRLLTLALSSLPPSHSYGAASEEERKLARRSCAQLLAK
jgi:hypothetical protein